MAVSSPRGGAKRFPVRVPEIFDQIKDPGIAELLRRIVQAVNVIADGGVNSVGSVTLTASATTTTILDKRIGTESRVFLSPMTANAAAAIATTYVSAVTEDSATLTHASNAQTDRTFGYVVLG